MEIFKRKIENPQVAYDRVREELIKSPALGSRATKDDIDRYNMLHDQLLEHRNGTRGHLYLKQEIVLFEVKLAGHQVILSRNISPKKIPYWLIPGTNNVIVDKK